MMNMTNPKWKVRPIFVFLLVLTMIGSLQIKAWAQAQGPLSIVPLNPIYVRGTAAGQAVLIAATTSNPTQFNAIAGTRLYVTQATCANASATALQLTIYDDGANAGVNATRPMTTITCPTSTTTGAYTQPVVFNPPLETAVGDAVDVGVLTAANSVTVSLNGFRGTR